MQKEVACIFSANSIPFFKSFHTMNQNHESMPNVIHDTLVKIMRLSQVGCPLKLDQITKQLDKDEFQEDKSMDAFWVLNNQFQKFIDWQYFLDYDSEMTKTLFVEYTAIQVKQFRETLLVHMGNVKKSVAERTRHKRQYDRRMNKRQIQSRESKVVSFKALDASLVVTECSGTRSDEHITSRSSGTYITHVVDADIRPVNDQVPSAEVHLTAQHNVLANEQQHTDQSEPSYDTYLLEKDDSNTTPDSTNMSHRGGEIDQDAKQYQAKSHLLKVEFLKMNDMDAPEFCEFFEINDLKAQLQAKTTLICNMKNQIKSVKEVSNEANVKHEIDVLETINIELESSVAKLLAENEKLNKENKHLKLTYKELYDSIKKTRIQTKDHNDSLIAQVNITPHYLSKVLEYVLAKPHHVIAPGSFRNSQEEPYGLNDMDHNHYLEEARKKTQERNRNSKPSVMHTTSLQNTINGSKPNPMSNNQISRSFPVSKSSCGMSNEVNSRAKVQSPKTRNNNKPVEPKSHTQKPGRQIAIRQRFSLNKSSAVHEKPNTPRSCLRWKPTGRIFKTAGLRWIPTGKMFTDNTTKVDSKPPNGSNDDISNPYECEQTLNVSAGTLNLSAALAHISSVPSPQLLTPRTISPGLVPQPPSPTPNVLPTKNDWDLLFCPMFVEYFNPSPSVVQHVLVAVVQKPVVLTGTPSSTRIDQDTPSISTSQTTQEEQSHVIPTSVEEDDHGIEVAHMDNDL
ncbi:hypothetical protein Tco_0606982 [Tanacetum coccineum]